MLALISCISITSIIRLFTSQDNITLLKKFTHKIFRRLPSKTKFFWLNNFELKISRGEFFQNYGDFISRTFIMIVLKTSLVRTNLKIAFFYLVCSYAGICDCIWKTDLMITN